MEDVLNSHISSDVVMHGLILSHHAVVVEGMVLGDIRCDQNVFITSTGTVVGSIVSRQATIEGKVEGNLYILEKLRCQGQAQIAGDILTPCLEIASVASLNGKCKKLASQEIEGIVREMINQIPKKSPAAGKSDIEPLSGRITPGINDSERASHREFFVHPL